MFHAHADRVRMTNIAQMINVLQAMILTDKEKMLLTPTYHVFEMYKPFQNATLLPAELMTPEYKHGEVAIPAVSVSAARATDGKMVAGAGEHRPRTSRRACHAEDRRRAARSKVTRRVLTTAAMNAHNTFDKPEHGAARRVQRRQAQGR